MTATSLQHQHEQGAAESGDSYTAWPGWVVCSVCRPPLPTARMAMHLGPAFNKQTNTHFVASSARTHMFLVLPLALYHILGAKSFTNTCSRWHLLHQTHVLGATFYANMHVVGATFCISTHVLGSSLLPSAPTHMSWVLTSALVNTHVLVLYSALTHMFCVLATFCTS